MEMDWYLGHMEMYHYKSCHISPSLHHRLAQAELLTDTEGKKVLATHVLLRTDLLHLQVILMKFVDLWCYASPEGL